jgi:uncharacterized protein involved in type VI secretion and phage assembly
MSDTTNEEEGSESGLPTLGGGRFQGKYRGTVVNNIDPEQRGRIMAIVPDVSGLVPTSWALPCLPWGGIQTGFFCVPPVGAGVWVEFEQGDPDYPIWTGCFFGSVAEVPATALLHPAPIPALIFQTTGQNALTVSDLPGPLGGIMLRSTTGASISVNEIGITIQNGLGASIILAGPSVAINGEALVVT